MKLEIGNAYTDGEGSLVLIFEMKDSKSAKYSNHNWRGLRIRKDSKTGIESYTEDGRYFTDPSDTFDLVSEAEDFMLYHYMSNIVELKDNSNDFWFKKFYEAYVKRNANEATE